MKPPVQEVKKSRRKRSSNVDIGPQTPCAVLVLRKFRGLETQPRRWYALCTPNPLRRYFSPATVVGYMLRNGYPCLSRQAGIPRGDIF